VESELTPEASRPVKVMRVIARMNIGGPAWQVSVLTRGLQDERFESTLLTGHVDSDEGDFIALRDPFLPHTSIQGLGRSIRPGDDLRAFLELVRLFRRKRPLIVHTHTAKAGVLGRLAAVVARVPIRVHTFHGHLLHGYFSPFKTRLLIGVEAVLARLSTHLVVVGERVRDDLLEAGVGTAEKFTVIPPGVDAPLIQPASESMSRLSIDHRLPIDRPIILFTGRLTAVKRVDRLIETARIVTATRPEALFVICGDGDLRGELERSSRDIADSVRFMGWQADLSAFLGAAQAVVLTSDNEGMPVGLIEAALAGRASVTTDVGSAREVVLHGRTGFVVAPDASAIADALLTILGDKNIRESFEIAASTWGRERFSTNRLVHDHQKLYQRLISGM